MLLVPLRNCFRDHSDLLWLDAWKAKILLCGQVKLHDAVSHFTPSSDRCIDCIGAFSIQTFSSSNLWRITYYCIHVFSRLCIQPPTNLAPPLCQLSTIESNFIQIQIFKFINIKHVQIFSATNKQQLRSSLPCASYQLLPQSIRGCIFNG